MPRFFVLALVRLLAPNPKAGRWGSRVFCFYVKENEVSYELYFPKHHGPLDADRLAPRALGARLPRRGRANSAAPGPMCLWGTQRIARSFRKRADVQQGPRVP